MAAHTGNTLMQDTHILQKILLHPIFLMREKKNYRHQLIIVNFFNKYKASIGTKSKKKKKKSMDKKVITYFLEVSQTLHDTFIPILMQFYRFYCHFV